MATNTAKITGNESVNSPGLARFEASPSITFQSVYPQGIQLSSSVIDLLEEKRKTKTALAFDEITLEDKPSDFHPNDVSLHSFVTRKIALKGCGILSAAMDTVTEAELALAIAKVGGMGILHRNLEAKTQADMIRWVRRKIHYGGMIDRPITFSPEDRYSLLQNEIKAKGWTFTSYPIVDQQGKLLGLLTRDEMDFVEGTNPKLSDIMKPRSMTITAAEGVQTEEAYQIMKERKVKKLPIVKPDDTLVGMYVWNDVKQDQKKRESFSLDDEGHFLVGAAIGLGSDEMTRVQLLVENKCKVMVLDSSHGACKPAKDQIKRIREKYGTTVEIIAGNIASYESAMYLLDSEYRPDALKVGIGPGSICTTRTVTGHGIPQVTAVYEVWRAINDYGKKTGYYVPIIADGGIRSSGDIVKCLAVGASSVMLGGVFAGTDESPGKVIFDGGKRYKVIRGMGSRSALEERSGSRVRYYRQDEKQHASEELTNEQKQKMVPEGVEGLVEYRGSVEKVMSELLGGIQAGLAHSGAPTLPTFQSKATFWTQSFAGVAEGNPHNITNVRQ
jgi:IMP dehydrogenase